MNRIDLKLIPLVLISMLFSGCASAPAKQENLTKSALTPGMTKEFIKKGVTTQADVMELFGPPNLITHRNNTDIWTYDQIANEISESGGYLTVLLAGIAGRKQVSSTRSTMLIIYFDEQDIVQDYRLSTTKF
ncbi:MAG TPA: hypothetical protein PLH79_17465 [bacterium]|nr:hypothetical protein [Candidatus Omnitrophota bacterium]HOL96142.1 hypothetical protein [bacterium]HPP00667.1 hypothetical protein [bacterium]HXK93024.1 hypothetical protein [bacterium]